MAPKTRSQIMASIHSKDTKPEMAIRRGLHALGFRYRTHARDLPGSPDLVLPRYKAVIQINGCFWHGHENCRLFKMPKTRVEYWQKKIERNRARDEKNQAALFDLGWRLMVVWECAIQGSRKLEIEKLLSLVESWILVGNDYIELRGDFRPYSY